MCAMLGSQAGGGRDKSTPPLFGTAGVSLRSRPREFTLCSSGAGDLVGGAVGSVVHRLRRLGRGEQSAAATAAFAV